MTPKDTPHTATQGASESDAFKRWAIENHHAYLTARGLRFVDDDEAALWTGWQGRAALAQRQPAPADPQAPSQDTSRGQARAPSHASKLELEPNGHTEECNRGIGDQSQSGNCATRSDAVRASGAEPCARSGDAAQHEVTEGRGLYGAPATPSQEAREHPPLPEPLTLSRGDEDGPIQLGYTAEQVYACIDADRKARQQEAPEMFTAEQVHAAEERARADERRNWTFVKSRIAYQGFSYGMGSQDGIDDLRRAIERNRHD